MKKWGVPLILLVSSGMLTLQYYIDNDEPVIKPSAQVRMAESVGVPLPAEAAALAPAQDVSFLEALKNKTFKTKEVTARSTIVMYTPPDADASQAAQMSLKFRGLSCAVVLFRDFEEIQALGIMDKLKDAGIATIDGESISVDAPFFKVDGKLLKREQLLKSIAQLPLMVIREFPGPYVVVYGIEDCPYSQKGVNALEDNDIPYEFRDVNNSKYTPRYMALVEVNGIKYHEWPLMDVSGHILSNPSIEQVRKYYR